MALYRCSGGSGGVTPASITPSNSSPAALTANNPVNPTANGYAIESYSSKTPSDSSPASVTSGSIIKPSANGYLFSSGSLFDLLKAMSSSKRTGVSDSSSGISVTSGKHYLIVATQIATNTAAESESITGATVEWAINVVNTGTSNSRAAWTKVYLVTATSSTITVSLRNGTVGRSYVAIELD